MRLHLWYQIYSDDENGSPTTRAVGVVNCEQVVVDICQTCHGTNEQIYTCVECNMDHSTPCTGCGGKGYTQIVKEQDYTTEDKEALKLYKIDVAWDEKIEYMRDSPIPLDKFVGDKKLSLDALHKLGNIFHNDVTLKQWPYAIREGLFTRVVEGLFDILGQGAPEEFYKNILPQLRKEFKPQKEVEEKQSKVKKKVNKKEGPGVVAFV